MATATTKRPQGKGRRGKYEETPLYAALRLAVTLIAPLIVKLRTEGIENIPAEGPVIIAMNHVAWVDVLLGALRVPRQYYYMAKAELFEVPIIGYMIRRWGAFPVRRGEGDREALRSAERVLAEGHMLVIFPEGHRTRGGPLLPGHPGAALIATRSAAPIVAVAISGTQRVFKGFAYGPWAPRVTIRYSKPFYLETPAGKRSRETVARGTDTIMRQIAAMLPEEYRGAYGDLASTAIVAGTDTDEPASRQESTSA